MAAPGKVVKREQVDHATEALIRTVRGLSERLLVVEEKLKSIGATGMGRQVPSRKLEMLSRHGEMTPDQVFRTDHIRPFNECPVPMNGAGEVVDPDWSYNEESDSYEHKDGSAKVIETCPGALVRRFIETGKVDPLERMRANVGSDPLALLNSKGA